MTVQVKCVQRPYLLRNHMGDAAEAKKHSQKHQAWMIDLLKAEGGSCTYGKIVDVGETHHCDTVGAMLKILKNRKAVGYKQMFLMYPMHKDEVVTLLNPDYDASQDND